MNNKNAIFLEKRYHNLVSEKYNQQRKRDYIWEIPEEIFLLKDKFFSNKTVIDMGCGTAHSVRSSISKKSLSSCMYVGVDISNKMLKIAKKNIKNGKFIREDISGVSLKRNVVNTVLSLGALHHTLNQIETLNRWLNLITTGGYLLLREPLFEALKRGYGASPIEEGIKIGDIETCLKRNNYKLIRKLYYGSNFLHLINRVFIKLFKSLWLDNKILWYPIVIVDIGISNSIGKFTNIFKGDTLLLIAQKL